MAREHNPPLYGDCPEGTPIAQQAPHAARAMEPDDLEELDVEF
jgi:hypothetical protein